MRTITLTEVLEQDPVWLDTQGVELSKKEVLESIQEGYHAIYFALPCSNTCYFRAVVITNNHKDHYDPDIGEAFEGFEAWLTDGEGGHDDEIASNTSAWVIVYDSESRCNVVLSNAEWAGTYIWSLSAEDFLYTLEHMGILRDLSDQEVAEFMEYARRKFHISDWASEARCFIENWLERRGAR